MIQSIPIEPKYKKENGLWVLDTAKTGDHCGFAVVEQSIVQLPVGTTGGNHRHPRIEAFIALGQNIKLYWLDEDNERQEVNMEELTLYVVPSNLPHAVKNTAYTSGFLLEFADGLQRDVVPATVID